MNADPARRVLPVEQYHALFDTIDAGFCIIEMLFDGDRAYDYRFLEVNAAYERQTGLRDAVGRTVRELVPGLEDVWFDIYGRVATTREPTRFDNGSEAMGRWFEVHAFPVGEPERHLVGGLQECPGLACKHTGDTRLVRLHGLDSGLATVRRRAQSKLDEACTGSCAGGRWDGQRYTSAA